MTALAILHFSPVPAYFCCGWVKSPIWDNGIWGIWGIWNMEHGKWNMKYRIRDKRQEIRDVVKRYNGYGIGERR